ncbi:hypothetical protein HAX54_042004 [Datura stramonium]|uniref:Putative plant transposon protein domain-containing protein n=1 Tax=Datura stramonium TaxID=4076 RepID=A0ABS8W3J9_DATST|nr:hypothetical protein [Datura stramonium]
MKHRWGDDLIQCTKRSTKNRRIAREICEAPINYRSGRRFKSNLKQSTHCIGEELISPHPILHQKIEDKANQFQWVAHLIAQGQPKWDVSKGLIHRHYLKFDARMWLDLVCSRLMPSQNTSEVPIDVEILLACIMKHVHINMGDIIGDQFRQKAKQQATALLFPSLVSMLCFRAECPLWRSLDKTIQVHGVITLDTKTDKEAPMIKWASQGYPVHDPKCLKKALQPAKDKLTHLCSKVDVLESQVEEPRSPPDDWWVGYHNNADIMFDEEELHHSPPLLPQMHSVYDVDPSWASRGVATTSYHELRTLLDRLVAPGPGLLVILPPYLMQPTVEDTTSWVFDAVTYTCKLRPNC